MRTSKKMLKYHLNIKDNNYLKQNFVEKHISPYIVEDKNGRGRLVEAPDKELKRIQSRIKKELAKMNYPDYVFSGVKGRSYVDNARLHIGKHHLYKIDLTAFFPSISREKVFYFFKNKLSMSPNIAKILTNFTTVNLDTAGIKHREEIDRFLKMKGIKTRNHLITGAPTSPILSYLVNQDMFEKLNMLSSKNGIKMTVYVDDIVFSSPNRISKYFICMIENIIGSQHYKLSKKKSKSHTRYYPKRVTGVIIDKQGNICIANSISRKIINRCNQLKANPYNVKCRRELRGLVEAARQVAPHAYPSVRKLAYDPNYKLPSSASKKKKRN